MNTPAIKVLLVEDNPQEKLLVERIRVLLVEDNPTDRLLVEDELAHTTGTPFNVVNVEQLSEALARIEVQRFDVVLLDLSLPDSHGFETFVRMHEAQPTMPIVVLSGAADGQLAVQAVQAGAQDYLVKGCLGEDVLPRSIRYAIERCRSDRSLAESEERYRRLIEQSPDGYMVHCDGVIVFANAAALKLHGAVGPEQLLGKPYLEVVAPEFHEIIAERVAKSLESGSNSGSNPLLELLSVRLDGTNVAVEATSNPFLHEGRPAVQVVLHDLTERKRAESRFRRLVDSNAQGVMFWNTKGEVTGANGAFLELVGYSREDLEAGRINWIELTPPEHAQLDEHAITELADKGVCTPYEKEFFRQDGTRVPLLIGVAVFEDNPEEGLCFTVDLSGRKKLEEQSLRTQRMESIGTLAGGIAHDLNNSLGPIIMSLDLLKMKFPDEASQELLAIIGSSAQRGADMVRQVLSFARGVEGRRMEVQIKHLVREIEKIANDTFLKHIQVRTIIPADLWTVLGDPTQLHQVLLNLCVNARDAMPAGGTLTISAENLTIDAHYAGLSLNHEAQAGPYVFLQVKDNGTGMPPGIIAKIFDPFFTTKEIGKGTGLGLSTSLGILKSHGGFIRVQSEPGKGTTFQIYLPAQTETSPAAAAEQAAEMPRGTGELILVVDDEASVRQITQQTLEAFGYRVVLAVDGAEAVATYARQNPEIAVVLTDMMMPVMDGPATIQVLRKMNPAVRIIAASGLAANGDATQATILGVKHFLPKPYTAETLLKTLKQVLEEK
jgi:PAS domain S-box-containing protein